MKAGKKELIGGSMENPQTRWEPNHPSPHHQYQYQRYISSQISFTITTNIFINTTITTNIYINTTITTLNILHTRVTSSLENKFSRGIFFKPFNILICICTTIIIIVILNHHQTPKTHSSSHLCVTTV